jgi:flagellar biosynthesis/type III secretory pathway M-ring protein FliF/YscJ
VAGDVQHAVLLKKQLAAKVKEDPEKASALVQNWIREPGQ